MKMYKKIFEEHLFKHTSPRALKSTSTEILQIICLGPKRPTREIIDFAYTYIRKSLKRYEEFKEEFKMT